MSDAEQGMSAEEIAEHNAWREKREAELRAARIENGINPDSWDG